MKIRCVTNSIRLRVRKSELATLQQQGEVVESLNFGPRTLTYRLRFHAELSAPKATFEDDLIDVVLPQTEAARWAATEQVGIEHWLRLPKGEQLHLLVEKDFPCKDRPEEDQSDTFFELAPEEKAMC